MPSKYEQYEALASSYEKHPEQGLKACKKKLQRDPNNVIFLLAQARFLQRLGREKDALASCEAIKASPKDPMQVAVIKAVQEITADCQCSLSTFSYAANPNIANLWKDALDSNPKHLSKELHSDMLRAALNNDYWDLAQQLFARLQKENPKIPHYHFAWVSLSEMQADKMLNDEKTSKNLRMLAYRSLKAAVDNTLANKDVPRRITSSKELRLVTQIYRQQGYDDELLAILDSAQIGIDSNVGKNDVEFVRVKMDVLFRQQRWKELNALSFLSLDRLCRYRENPEFTIENTPGNIAWADDWHVWQSLVKTSSYLSDPENLEKIQSLIQRFLVIAHSSRNAGRASLLYHSYHRRIDLLEECKAFFRTHRTKVSCFDDLKEFLELLEDGEQKVFDKYVSKKENSDIPAETDKKAFVAWITSASNALKIEYLLCISKPFNPSSEELKHYICACLNLYKLSVDASNDSGDDICILSIMTLLKLEACILADEVNHTTTYVIQAACLLQALRDNSPDNYKATLLRLCISQLLGLGSIALSSFHDLSIREVQFDTLSHLLYTRISSTHPFDVKLRNLRSLDDRHKDPSEGINFALKWKPRAVDAFLNFMSKDPETIHFDKILEFSQFKERLEASFTRALLQVGRRRIARLTDRASTLEETVHHFKNATSDNRDFFSIPDFEYTGRDSFASRVLIGVKPGMYWLARHTLNDIFQTMLTWKSQPSTSQLQILSDAIAYIHNHDDLRAHELTSSEQLVSRGWDLLQPVTIYLILGPTAQNTSKDVKTDIQALLNWLGDTQIQTPMGEECILPQWSILQHFFLNLELLKALDRFSDTALSLSKQKTHHTFNKIPADFLQKVKKATKGNAEQIQRQAKAWKMRLEKSGTEEILKVFNGADVVGKALEDVIGSERMKQYAKDFVESGCEALDGILRVKI